MFRHQITSTAIAQRSAQPACPDMDSEKAPSEHSLDWEKYRLMSLSGFGEERVNIWPKLLHATAEPHKSAQVLPDDEASSHPDERQIRLDTERSFVLYPVDSKTDKDTLQAELHDLLVEIFRKRPKLNYFQGYHDIVTVLLLTLPKELQLPCAEQLSLQRVRDSMGSTLEPILGLLRVMRNLLRAEDPKYAELLERTSPLPYYALSNLLTLFSHDMPTLPLIQHVFDYLLCRPPIFVVYLASAVILSRKPDVERLEEEGEEGMMHSILSALPEIVDNNESDDEGNQSDEELPSEDVIPDIKQEPDLSVVSTPVDTQLKEEFSEDSIADPPDLSAASDVLQNDAPNGDLAVKDLPPNAGSNLPEDHDASVSDDIAGPDPPPVELAAETKTELPSTTEQTDESGPRPTRRKVSRSKHTLPDILRISEALYQAHPPSHPSLQLSHIMGPQSVIFTWSSRLSDMPSNDEAECMVDRLDLIVYPEPPVVEPKEKDNVRRQRKRLKKRRGTGSVGLLVGAGLVLGVAVAVSVYGARQGGDPTRDWRKMGRWIGRVLAGASERIHYRA
ncbi:rab-GTPase-TBC domain-containing protein [Mycena vitilis]|nr:rab-GTPase-TBC domain-containing protein [Mycena vitilis]KAJ6493640.1 rab-GTPase-TBC domain-containing protein [Mycena vitilis]